MRILYILISLSALSITSCKHDKHEKHEETKFAVTNPIVKDTLIYHEYVGQIHSIQHVELEALEKGYLQNVYVDEGQPVQKGQLMFQIMPIIYNAEVEKAMAERSFAEIEYQNTKSLADSNIVSKNELALSKATLSKAEAELALAKAHLNFTEIRAPFNGLVGRFRDVRLGSLIDEGDLLTTLSDNSKMWVYFNVPEAEYLNYITRLKSDSMLRVKLQMANGKIFDEIGVVETIEADFNNETGNIAFRATFLNPNRILRNGQTGNVLVPRPLVNATLIPQKATFEILEKKFVFVIDDKGIVRSREIEVGAELNHLYVVKKGLTPKDKVLLEGLRKVSEGEAITTKMVKPKSVLSHLELYTE